MPGIKWFGTTKGPIAPIVSTGLIGKNTYIRAGDPLIVTTKSSRAGSGGHRVLRPLYGVDCYSGGNYIGRQNGFAGIALYSVWTDSNGKLIPPATNEGLTLTGPNVVYPNQALEMSQYETTTGFCRVVYARWTPGNLFVGQAKSDQAFSDADVGKLVTLYYNPSEAIREPDTLILNFTVYSGSFAYPAGRVVRVILPTPADTDAGKQLVVVEPLSNQDQVALGDAATT